MSFIWYPNDEDVASSTVAGGGAPITVMAVKELEGEDGEAMIKSVPREHKEKEIINPLFEKGDTLKNCFIFDAFYGQGIIGNIFNIW
ncbi:uncharacterized protein DS421_18g612820 [Arachis hypogaea]|nr:uncharacterized protein DS421_18g612820 [Arachis hypogaea]